MPELDEPLIRCLRCERPIDPEELRWIGFHPEGIPATHVCTTCVEALRQTVARERGLAG